MRYRRQSMVSAISEEILVSYRKRSCYGSIDSINAPLTGWLFVFPVVFPLSGGSKYNDDPFDTQVQKPGMPDDMKARIQALVDKKVAEEKALKEKESTESWSPKVVGMDWWEVRRYLRGLRKQQEKSLATFLGSHELSIRNVEIVFHFLRFIDRYLSYSLVRT